MFLLFLLFIPFLNFTILNVMSNKAIKIIKMIIIFLILIQLSLCCFNFIITYISNNITIYLMNYWFLLSNFKLYWNFLYDNLTILMLMIVSLISSIVHFYSISYMKLDPFLYKFLSFLSLFTFFMLILITSDNFIQLFIGWEGVGVCSYLLINFWNSRIQANKSSIKAILINKIGDMFMIIAFSFLFYFSKSLNFFNIFNLINTNFLNIIFFIQKYNTYILLNVINIICIFLFIGAMCKSAQIILHIWLPDAMEGPTPVSALIHAATMVTAGIFLIIRCSFIFEYSKFVLFIIIIIGSITTLYAASIGLIQNDLKKIIAYSTCSQLGYMIFVCGFSGYSISLFHLTTHAFFKALLFLSAGSIIHSLNNEQDMRKMGGLKYLLPIIYIIFFLGSLTLLGFPFFSGFYSKDLILELSLINFKIVNYFAYLLIVIAAFCTSFYSIRSLILTFILYIKSFKNLLKIIHESSKIIINSLLILLIFSIFLGYFFKNNFINFGYYLKINIYFWLNKNYYLTEIEFLSYLIKILPIIISFLGIIVFLCLQKINFLFLFKNYDFVNTYLVFLNKKWFFDKLFNYIYKILLNFNKNLAKNIDKYLILKIQNKIKKFPQSLSKVIEFLHNNIYYFYILIYLLQINLFFIMLNINVNYIHLIYIYIILLYLNTKIYNLIKAIKLWIRFIRHFYLLCDEFLYNVQCEWRVFHWRITINNLIKVIKLTINNLIKAIKLCIRYIRHFYLLCDEFLYNVQCEWRVFYFRITINNLIKTFKLWIRYIRHFYLLCDEFLYNVQCEWRLLPGRITIWKRQIKFYFKFKKDKKLEDNDSNLEEK